MKIPATVQHILLAAVLAGIFICALYLALHPAEPSYQGREIIDWAEEVFPPYMMRNTNLQSALRTQNAKAAAAIRSFGTNALPIALKLIQARDSWFRRKLARATEYDSDGIVKYLIAPSWKKNYEGANIIWTLGPPQAEAAIPILIQQLQSSDRQLAENAEYALPATGTNAIPRLIKLLGSADENVRRRTARALGIFGLQTNANVFAPVVVPALIRCIQIETNRFYFWALGSFGTNAESAVPILVGMLQLNPPVHVPRPPALDALYRINPKTAKSFMEQWHTSITNYNSP